MQRLLDKLHANPLIENSINPSKNKWNALLKKQAFDKRKFDAFIEKIEKILKTDLGKGFVELTGDNAKGIQANQTIDYSRLKKYFSTISITIIK